MGGDPQQHQPDQGDAALSAWFPRPATAADIELLAPSPSWTAARAFELFGDPFAEEWRQKVGVAGPLDGSAKSTTRLLASRGFVAKTRIDVGCASFEEAASRAAAVRAIGERAGVWHPAKVWLVVRALQQWFPTTICPLLLTVRAFEDVADRMNAWIDMIQASIDVDARHGLGLDLNPSNFGVERRGERLHYVDDELYEGFSARNVAGAIVARVLEEPSLDEDAWRAWASVAARRLRLEAFSWSAIREEVRLYPVPERFEARRSALLSRLPTPERRKPASARRLTCVIADVHANMPALEAVLDDARSRGADSYLFLGDAVGYGPHPSACVRTLAALDRAVVIRGNHDHAIASGRFDVGMNTMARACAEWTRSALGASDIAWLASLPVEHVEEDWMAVHGAPKDPHRFLAYVYELTYEDNLRCLRDKQTPVCFFGHTHVQLTHAELARGPVKMPGERTIQLDERHCFLVNPGSVGQPRDGDARAAYAMWNRETREVETLRVPYDLERTIRDIVAAGLPTQLEPRLRAGA